VELNGYAIHLHRRPASPKGLPAVGVGNAAMQEEEQSAHFNKWFSLQVEIP